MSRGPRLLLAAPAVVLLGGLLGAALLFSLAQSLGWWSGMALPAPSLHYYRLMLDDRGVVSSLLLTLAVAASATAAATVLGLGLALLLRSLARRAGVWRLLVQLPLPVPHLVAAISIGLLLTQSGLLARALAAGGLIETPADMPALVYDRWAIGIVLTYVWKEAPFVALAVLAVLTGRTGELEAAARTLGATRFQALCSVTLPLLAPALLGAATVVFVFTLGAFEVPLLLGQSYPRMLAVEAYARFGDTDLRVRPLALAINTLILLLAAVAAVPYWKLLRATAAEAEQPRVRR